MARWAPLKKDQLEALAKEILHNYGRGRAIIAVDGPADAGADAFADDLATAFETLGHAAFRASMDDFHRARSQRGTPAESYDRAYDYSVLRRVLLEPFTATSGTGFVLAAFDTERDAALQSKWTTTGPDAVLILDGRFLHRPELAGSWNYSIWVEAESAEPVPGTDSEADRLYIDQVGPRGKAVAIIDNRDPEHPKRVFADSC
jgi:uridine kinase